MIRMLDLDTHISDMANSGDVNNQFYRLLMLCSSKHLFVSELVHLHVFYLTKDATLLELEVFLEESSSLTGLCFWYSQNDNLVESCAMISLCAPFTC